MRILNVIILLSAAVSVQARDMFVVVHTRDARVELYTCELPPDVVDNGLAMTRTVLRDAGHFSWHVVGGVEPYTVIESEGLQANTLCVTVIDAVGNIATGCGVLRTVVDVRSVRCPQFNSLQADLRPLPGQQEGKEVLQPFVRHAGPDPVRPVRTPAPVLRDAGRPGGNGTTGSAERRPLRESSPRGSTGGTVPPAPRTPSVGPKRY